MDFLWWAALGAAIGVAGMLPLLRILLRRGERRARQAERRARNAERLAELGSMTGGLAHEIKNPLSTIGLNAQLLREAIVDAELAPEMRDRLLARLDALSREAERLRGILTDFLQFAGQVKLDAQPRDLSGIVTEVTDFFHPQCDQNRIVLRTQLADHPVMVRVDERLLKQALLNLMINATQAMEEQAAARGTAGTEQPRAELIVRLVEAKNEAQIHVIDTGPGIEHSRLDEIFHPYVSLKSGGTGLGLPSARRIIEEHGGRLLVHSELGRGSDFVIHLPLEEARRHEGTEARRD